MEDLNDYEKLTSEDIYDIIFCLRNRRDMLESKMRFYNDTIKSNSRLRLELLSNLISSINADILKIDMEILKLDKLDKYYNGRN